MAFIDPQDDAGRPPRRDPRLPSRGRCPATSAPLDAQIPGAGRMRDLPQWVTETHSTSLLVLDGRWQVVVHEWYADGLGPESLLLGASMTKSVLAHLVGNAVAVGRAAARATPVAAARARARRHRVRRRCTVEHLLTMTTGVDWVEDHRDPSGPATPAARPASPATAATRATCWRRSAAMARARHPARTTAPPTRRCSTGCASAPPARTYADGARPSCGACSAASATRSSASTRARRRAGRRRSGRLRRGLGCGSRPSSSPARRTTRACSDPTGCDALLGAARTVPRRPAGCPAASPRTPASARTGGRSTPTASGSPPTAAGASSPTSTATSTSWWSRPRCGPTTTGSSTGSSATCSYLGLPRSSRPRRGRPRHHGGER